MSFFTPSPPPSIMARPGSIPLRFIMILCQVNLSCAVTPFWNENLCFISLKPLDEYKWSVLLVLIAGERKDGWGKVSSSILIRHNTINKQLVVRPVYILPQCSIFFILRSVSLYSSTYTLVNYSKRSLDQLFYFTLAQRMH